MIKLLLPLMIFMAISHKAYFQCDNQQKLVNPQSIWYFIEGGSSEPPSYFKTRFSEIPTLINGIICFEKLRLNDGQNAWQPTNEYYHEANDIVTIFNGGGSQISAIDICHEIGDTLFDKYNDSLIVIAKDTVVLKNGEVRSKTILKCIHDTDNLFDETYYIEGIGTKASGINGAYLNCAFYDGFEYLLCFESDGEVIYSNENYCIAHADDQSNMNYGLSIKPNPALDIINIKVENGTNANIHLYDALGNLLSSDVEISLEGNIDVRELCPGLYFIKYELENHRSVKVNSFVKR
jgi:hypothetical protein